MLLRLEVCLCPIYILKWLWGNWFREPGLGFHRANLFDSFIVFSQKVGGWSKYCLVTFLLISADVINLWPMTTVVNMALKQNFLIVNMAIWCYKAKCWPCFNYMTYFSSLNHFMTLRICFTLQAAVEIANAMSGCSAKLDISWLHHCLLFLENLWPWLTSLVIYFDVFLEAATNMWAVLFFLVCSC